MDRQQSQEKRQGLIVTGALFLALGVGAWWLEKQGFLSRFSNNPYSPRPNIPELVRVVPTAIIPPTKVATEANPTAEVATEVNPTAVNPTAELVIDPSKCKIEQPELVTSETPGFSSEPGMAAYNFKTGKLDIYTLKEIVSNPDLVFYREMKLLEEKTAPVHRGTVFINTSKEPIYVTIVVKKINGDVVQIPEVLLPGERIFRGIIFSSSEITGVFGELVPLFGDATPYFITGTYVDGSRLNGEQIALCMRQQQQ